MYTCTCIVLSAVYVLVRTCVTCLNFFLSSAQSFGGLEGVEVDPGNPSNLIFTFRNKAIASQVQCRLEW